MNTAQIPVKLFLICNKWKGVQIRNRGLFLYISTEICKNYLQNVLAKEGEIKVQEGLTVGDSNKEGRDKVISHLRNFV